MKLKNNVSLGLKLIALLGVIIAAGYTETSHFLIAIIITSISALIGIFAIRYE